ncbi:RING finger protein 112 isoform X4 [Pipistrellus kuhlii]|uniref:RING finger protein 112 isoform X4 n=1 Tax=Pipistrellus kuhlii TaxID=59472 RepID=UPI001E27349E|nr:RING finger protein 112 isoform X4 [Pipistrellus kuhlii]
MEQAPSPFCPYLFRLHGDSPLPAACIPASARDSEPGRSLPPLGLFPHPASSPASPETAPLSTDLTSSSQLWLGSSTTPSALRLPRAAHPSLRGLTVSGPLPSASGPAPRPAAHAQARLLTHFLLSPVWQTGEKAEPHGKQRQQLVPHAAPQAGAGPGVRARGAPGAARLHPLLGEAPAGPVPPAPQGSAEGPAGPGGEDGAPAAEAAARPAGARRGAGAAAAGARGRGGRPAAQDGRREPRPEAPAGPRHARLPARRAGRAAPREGPAPPQPAAGAARPGGRREAEGWPSGEGALPGCRWGADSPDRGVRMWSQPFLLGKEGQQVREAGGPGGEGRGEEEGRQAALSLTLAQVAVFLVDTGDAMSPELSPETRTKLCALIMMLSSYQILHTSRELEDTDLECLEMFVHVAEVMGRHYGMVPIQRLDLLVRDSPHPSPAGRGPVGDALPRSGKYPRVRELLRGRQARRCLLPAPRPPRAGRGRGSPGGECPGGRGPSRPPRDRPPHCQCPPPRSPLLPQPVLSERPRRPRGRRLPAAGLRRRGAERGPPARQEPQPGLRERGAPRGPGGRAPAHRAAAGSGNQEPLGLDGAAGARLRLSGGDGRPAAGPADGGGRQAGVQGVRAAAGRGHQAHLLGAPGAAGHHEEPAVGAEGRRPGPPRCGPAEPGEGAGPGGAGGRAAGPGPRLHGRLHRALLRAPGRRGRGPGRRAHGPGGRRGGRRSRGGGHGGRRGGGWRGRGAGCRPGLPGGGGGGAAAGGGPRAAARGGVTGPRQEEEGGRRREGGGGREGGFPGPPWPTRLSECQIRVAG